MHSYAFGVLRLHAARNGDPPPRLLGECRAGRRGAGAAGRRTGGLAGRPGARIGLAGAAAPGDRAAGLRRRAARTAAAGGRARAGAGRAARRWGSGTTCRSGSPPGGSSARTSRWCCCAGRGPGRAAGRRARRWMPPSWSARRWTRWRATPSCCAAERARVRHLLVDDAQDLDPQQMELVRVLGGTARTVVLAGDPDQAVLGFRGADPGGLDDRGRARRWCSAWTAYPPSAPPGPGSPRGSPGGARRPGARASPDDTPFRPAIIDGGGGSRCGCWRRPRRRPGSRTGCGARTCNTASPGRRWPCCRARRARSLPTLRRALLAAGVPITAPPDELPPARQPAVVPLLMVLRYAARPGRARRGRRTALLASPLGSADPMRLRRLRRGLLRLHAADGRRCSGACGSRHEARDDGGRRGAHRQRPTAGRRAARRRPGAARSAGRAAAVRDRTTATGRGVAPRGGSGHPRGRRCRAGAVADLAGHEPRTTVGRDRGRRWSGGAPRIGTWTRCSRSSTALPGTPTGCPARTCGVRGVPRRPAVARPTPSPRGHPTRMPSRCSPHMLHGAGSGGSWPCPASRRAPGRTCGYGEACWATSGWSIWSPGWPSPPPRCRGSRRCWPRSAGCSTSRARGPGRRCWSARCRRTAPH